MTCDSWLEDGGDGEGETAARSVTAVWHSISKYKRETTGYF